MVNGRPSEKELQEEVKTLRYQLETAQETLRAIGNGEVDALVIAGSQGEQVYTLQGADSSYRLLVEEMKEGAATITTDSTLLLYCNKRLAALVKTPLKRLIGTDFKQFIAPFDLILFEALCQKAHSGSGKGELRLIARDGTEIPVYLSISILNQKGVDVGCLIITDLSEQKQDEEIIAQERLTRLLLEKAAESIIVCNHQGKIIRASEEAHKILGKNLLLSNFDDMIKLELLPKQNGSQPFLKKQRPSTFSIVSVINGSPYQGQEVEFLREDGRKFNFLLSASPLSIPHNNLKGCVIILTNSNDELIREIAERQLLENKLHQINEQLEQRVEQRTNELAQAIEDLKQEAIERQKTTLALQESEARFRAAIDGSLDAFFLLQSNRDEAGKLIDFLIVDMNAKAEEMIAQNKENLIGKGLGDVFPWGCELGYFEKYLRVFKTHKGFEEELAVSNPTVKAKWVQLQVIPLYDGIAVTCRDITERKQTEEAAQEVNEKLTRWVDDLEQRNRETLLLGQMSEFLQACNSTEEAYQVINELLKPFFPNLSGSLFVIKSSKNIVEMVASWGELSGVSESIFAPQDCWALRRGRRHFVASCESSLLCKHIPKKIQQHQLHLINSSDIPLDFPTETKLSFISSPMFEHLCVPMIAQGDALGLLCLASHKSGQLSEDQQRLATSVAEHIALALANLKLREALEYQSIRDSLTGLYNRRYLEESLEREINRAQRQKFNLGVIMIDIDHFKHYNDTFGHEAGDIVLQKLGNVLQKNIRGSDIACRYGGEEFTLILPEVSLEIVQERAENIRVEVQKLKLQHHDLDLGQITLSLGIALFPSQGLTGESVVRAADSALYQAKQQGRNRVCVFSKTFEDQA